MKTRVFVFGLDAASPYLIERWIEDLPNLRRLTLEGTWGVLHSTIPPFTSPAWACMVTGKNPAKVGIFGLRHREDGKYKFRPPTSAYRRAPAIWDIAGQMGKQSVVVNVPDTYPPTPINGVMVSGHPAPVEAGVLITYPSDLQSYLHEVSGGYLVGPPSGFDDESQGDEYPVWLDVLARQQTAVENLIAQHNWDLFFYVSLAIDGIGHHFWKHLDNQHPDYDGFLASKYGDILRQTYIKEDQRIGRILNNLTKDDLFLVVSDHGSAPCYRHIAVNKWLIEQGYLVLKADRSIRQKNILGTLARQVFSLYRQMKWVRQLAKPFRQTILRDVMVQSHFLQKSKGRLPFDALPIDWAKTKAYYLGDDRLYLNVLGREPQGSIHSSDYLKKREELKIALLQAQNPENSTPLFSNVYTREEIYNGPFLDLAPDLVLVPGNENWNLGSAVGNVIVDRPVVSGKHHPEGVFLAWGAGVRGGQRLPASIYDIASTILHTLAIPVPSDADGKVQLSWFSPESEIAQRPIMTKSYPEVNFSTYDWTQQEQKQVEDRLRDLGYLD